MVSVNSGSRESNRGLRGKQWAEQKLVGSVGTGRMGVQLWADATLVELAVTGAGRGGLHGAY